MLLHLYLEFDVDLIFGTYLGVWLKRLESDSSDHATVYVLLSLEARWRMWKQSPRIEFEHMGKRYNPTDFINLAFSDVKLWFWANLNTSLDEQVCVQHSSAKVATKGRLRLPNWKREKWQWISQKLKFSSSPPPTHQNSLSWFSLSGVSKEKHAAVLSASSNLFWGCFQGCFH